jgi:AraC-like DNA-binding protein/ligand-binding sensor protein
MANLVNVTETGTLSEKLSQSQIMRDYERAFSDATGLPLKFQPAGKKRPGMRGSRNANPFCVQMAETEPGCKMCVDMQERLSADSAGGTTQTAACIAGLSDSAVPVRAGDKVLGYLQTGQVALRPLTRESFGRVAQWLKQGGVEADWKELEKAYLRTRVISPQQYDAVLRLLEVFSQHLSIAAEQIATQQMHAEPPMVERARKLIEERHGEELSLGQVASTVNASTFYFCKMFKRATGMTFTEYLSMVRVAKAKKLLANPQARISEVAFEAGFASLTHFNRVFRRITGQSPTAFRQKAARV